MPRYAMLRTVRLPFEEADRRVREELKQEGFGILTEIDVAATLKEKLGVEFTAYKILGACNPPLAHQALQSEPDIGLLLPCNVVVRSLPGTAGETVVEILDPVVQFELSGNERLRYLAEEARSRLERALSRLATQG
jgi:uncharacterized protein (DUF302 family)